MICIETGRGMSIYLNGTDIGHPRTGHSVFNDLILTYKT